ncbi:MAG: dihydrodipicolinate synthase family protein [Pseudomonadota bacterium]
MSRATTIFSGCIPALMTPCDATGTPDFATMVTTASQLIDAGMRAVVYCGSMGDWPLLTDEQRQLGVEALVGAGIPVVVGTGAQSPARAEALAAHAEACGADGLMVIPRVLSRGMSSQAQAAHFARILDAAPSLPAVIYNSPYYGFETKAPLFEALRRQHANLIGFKEFGGADSLSYAAEHITAGHDDLTLMVGVDTQVVHGYVRCGAKGAITGVGNALPDAVLRLVTLCERAATGDGIAFEQACALDEALTVLAKFDEGPDLVLFYKRLMVLEGHEAYQHHVNKTDSLTNSQRAFVDAAWRQFRAWWDAWPGRVD